MHVELLAQVCRHSRNCALVKASLQNIRRDLRLKAFAAFKCANGFRNFNKYFICNLIQYKHHSTPIGQLLALWMFL